MGVAEIIGFAACWLAVASLMLWGVFTEHRRGELFEPRLPRSESRRLRRAHRVPNSSSGAEWHPSRLGRSADEWVVAEQADGGTPDVGDRVRFLAGAWLASRGVDIDALHPEDIRLEVTTDGDGVSNTRLLIRSRALQASRRRH
jgi:hypothetical protein